MTIRRFAAADAPSVCEIFYRSVHEVAPARYDEAQVAASAPELPDESSWLPRLLEYETFVADNDSGETMGWIAMSPTGYIDMFYCLPEATRTNVASELYSAVEHSAARLKLAKLTAHASLFAQSFFRKHGWTIDTMETITRNGTTFHRAVMSKALLAQSRATH
jgi:putative acetyltransferase